MVQRLQTDWEWIVSLEEESAVRLEKTGAEGITAIFSLAGFEFPKTSSDEARSTRD
jgi:hypothetical protein